MAGVAEMSAAEEPFRPIAQPEVSEEFQRLIDQPVPHANVLLPAGAAPVTAIFDGFDLNEQPLISGLALLPGEIVPASSIVPLEGRDIGRKVVVLFEQGDPRRPIVMGLVQAPRPATKRDEPAPVVVQADQQRYEITAEREIVLRCGNASITLTRAGKIIIKGAYVLSRSSGHNKIKGAAVEIN
jgi:hypothetical protein